MRSLGILFALGTSLSWALGNVLTQRLGRLVGPPRAMLWAMATGGALAAPFAVLLDARDAPFDAQVALWAALAAIAGVVAYVGLFFAFAHEGLTIAVPVVSSWPLVAVVLAIAFFGESIRGLRLAGAAVILLGVVLVSLPRRRTPADARALTAAIAAALGFGVMIPAMGRIAPATGAFGATVLVDVLGVALAAVVSRAARVSLAVPSWSAWKLVVATGAAETSGFVCVALARRFAPMTLVAPVASLSATFTVVYAWLALGERPRPVVLLGAILAGLGVVLLAM